MFRSNTAHRQGQLFGIESQLPAAKIDKLRRSWEWGFYETVFRRIPEKRFAVLFSDQASRPNAPVNVLVGAILLRHRHNWTTRQLFERIDFDLLTRTALGLKDLEETPFCAATFFNFAQRLGAYYSRTGINLLEACFEELTIQQLRELSVRTSIQRCDSFSALSNIRRYGRLQLLVEVLIRLWRVLHEQDRRRFAALLDPYVRQKAEQYMYDLDRQQIPVRLAQLAGVYQTLYEALEQTYHQEETFAVFARVYREHFCVEDGQARLLASKALSGSTLQSPDDLDAAYRRKNDRSCRGQSVHVAETCHPDNALNLITDVSVHPATTDDSTILEQRLPLLCERTPNVEELHTDGSYGSEANDAACEQRRIRHVATEGRGRPTAVPMRIQEVSSGSYCVSCPHQSVLSEPTRKRHKACFDRTICQACPGRRNCPSQQYKRCRTFYFKHTDVLRQRRLSHLRQLPPNRRTLRANVEATIKEFTRGFNHKGKLRVRGRFSTWVYALSMAMVINYSRIWRAGLPGDRLGAAARPFCKWILEWVHPHGGYARPNLLSA